MGLIKSICWSTDDKKIVSAANDGVIYEWSIQSFNRIEENILKGIQYQNIFYNIGNNILMLDNNGIVKQLVDNTIIYEFTPTQEHLTSVTLNLNIFKTN